MFVVIICENCKQSIQVSQSDLGRLVQCPLCHQSTPAQMVNPLPVAKPIEQQELLSLDEAEQLPPKPISIPQTNPKKTKFWVLAVTSLTLTVAIMMGIYAWFKSGSGEIIDTLWQKYKYPDALCTIEFPSSPIITNALVDDYPVYSVGKTYTVRRWFEGVDMSMTWIDLDPEKAKNTTFELMVEAEKDKESKRVGSKPVRESAVNFVIGKRRFDGMELQFQTPEGTLLERFHMEKETKYPRLYILQISGKKLKADSKAVIKFFESFKPE